MVPLLGFERGHPIARRLRLARERDDRQELGLRLGQGPDLTWIGPGSEGVEATKQRRLKADSVTFATDRAGVFGTGDVRIGAATVVEAIAEGRRSAYAVDAYLRGMDLAAIRTRQTLAEPQPEFLSIVPF
ncbi:MAG TPA: hypothetical protein VK194_03105, partial [Candidatus Deferrimicrobium sp.]|nr:hypothetical protein [Candidatus Deferrimicrobium sp.]